MANSRKRERERGPPLLLSPFPKLTFKLKLRLLFPFLFLLLLLVLVLLLVLYHNSSPILPTSLSFQTLRNSSHLPTFDCQKCPQPSPVFASYVEGVRHAFLYSLADLGNLPDKPHKNIVRMLKGKPFRRPDISVAIQDVLHKLRADGRDGFVVDVGANVGMATFAASAMGFRVLAFEPVFENLQRICDGIFLNRVSSLVTVFEAAASDRLGNITFHKLVGRLDNSAVSETGAKLAFKSNEEIALQVKSIPLDEVIPDTQPVVLLKIDVQGWEYHVLIGASKLLSRKKGEAPYLIYEEDKRLLQASNSSAMDIREFLRSVGYNHCSQRGTDAHCTKE